MAGAAVYRIDASGQLARILAAPDIQRPNGIQISPDDKTLYLIEANGADGGARMIRAYDLRPDGTVSNMRVHYNFYPGRSADGMSIDTQGNLYASAGLHQLQQLQMQHLCYSNWQRFFFFFCCLAQFTYCSPVSPIPT